MDSNTPIILVVIYIWSYANDGFGLTHFDGLVIIMLMHDMRSSVAKVRAQSLSQIRTEKIVGSLVAILDHTVTSHHGRK